MGFAKPCSWLFDLGWEVQSGGAAVVLPPASSLGGSFTLTVLSGEGRAGREHSLPAPAYRGSQVGALGPHWERNFPVCASLQPGTNVLSTGEQKGRGQDPPLPRDAGCVFALRRAGIRKLHFERGEEWAPGSWNCIAVCPVGNQESGYYLPLEFPWHPKTQLHFISGEHWPCLWEKHAHLKPAGSQGITSASQPVSLHQIKAFGVKEGRRGTGMTRVLLLLWGLLFMLIVPGTWPRVWSREEKKLALRDIPGEKENITSWRVPVRKGTWAESQNSD